MSFKRTLLLCSSFAALAMQAAAQDVTPGPVKIERVVVTARKTAEDAQKIPVTVTTFNPEQIEDLSIENVQDLQYFTPGLQVSGQTSSPGGVSFNLRGQSQADTLLTTDSSVGVYLDNIYIPRVFGLKAAMADVQRIEVLKGPQGTLYGKNTTGGAINIITRKPDYDFGGYIDAEYGSYSMFNAMGVANLPIVDDMLALRVVVSSHERDGVAKDGLGRDLDDIDSKLYRGHLLWDVSPGVELLVTADYTRMRQGGYNFQITHVNPIDANPLTVQSNNPLCVLPAAPVTCSISGIIATSFQLFGPAGFSDANVTNARATLNNLIGGDFYRSDSTGDQFTNIDMGGLAATLTIDLGDDYQLRSYTAQREFQNHNQEDLDGTPFTLLHPNLRTEGRSFTQEINLSEQDGKGLDWILGGFFQSERGRDGSTTIALFGINPANPNITEGIVENDSWSVYGQGNLPLTDDLTLTAGLRWTEDTKGLVSHNRVGAAQTCVIPVALRDDGVTCKATFEDEFSDYSYLLSLDWQVIEDVLLYAKASRGFRSGGQNLRGSSQASSFQPFAPEIAEDIEIGMKSDLDDGRLRFNVSAYWTDYTDIQRSVLAPAGAGVVTILTNAAGATIKGVEIEAIWNPVEELTFFATVGYVDASYDEFTDLSGPVCSPPNLPNTPPPCPIPATLVAGAPFDRTHEVFNNPKWAYSLIGQYEVPLDIGRLKFTVDWAWRDETNFSPPATNAASVTQDAYGLLGARVALHIEDWDADVAVFGRNLTDEEYFQVALGLAPLLGWNVGYGGEPLIAGVEVKKNFSFE